MIEHLRGQQNLRYNNIIFCTGNNNEYGIYEYDANSIPASVNNNDIFDCTTALYRLNTSVDYTDIADVNALAYAASNISIDPSFNDASNNDFHLTGSTSVSVTGGGLNGVDESWLYFPENALGNPIDKDQVERPESGSNWSMGAYEHIE